MKEEAYIYSRMAINTRKSLSFLLDNAKMSQDIMRDNPNVNGWSGGHYLSEFCTVKLRTSRRCGHTEAILQEAYHRFTFFL